MYSRIAALIRLSRLPRFPDHDMAAFDHPQGVRTKDSVVTHSKLPLPDIDNRPTSAMQYSP